MLSNQDKLFNRIKKGRKKKRQNHKCYSERSVLDPSMIYYSNLGEYIVNGENCQNLLIYLSETVTGVCLYFLAELFEISVPEAIL